MFELSEETLLRRSFENFGGFTREVKFVNERFV
jgi:hypothetical protein